MRWLRGFISWMHDQPELARVSITAAIGTVLAWITYEIVHFLNPLEPKATTSWGIAFAIGVLRQHHLHRTLSFPRNGVPYGLSLWRDILGSIGILVASVVLNFVLTQKGGVHHRVAWAICLASVAVFDYLMMKFFVFRSRETPQRSR